VGYGYLQQVDNLKPSKYFGKLIKENVIGNSTIKQVKKEIKSYYTKKNKKRK